MLVNVEGWLKLSCFYRDNFKFGNTVCYILYIENLRKSRDREPCQHSRELTL
jgi:hypothetical protein